MHTAHKLSYSLSDIDFDHLKVISNEGHERTVNFSFIGVACNYIIVTCGNPADELTIYLV